MINGNIDTQRNYMIQKDGIADFLLRLNDTLTPRQARINAIKIYRIAQTYGVVNNILTNQAIQSLLCDLSGPSQSSKPKTFESWFLQKEIERMKYPYTFCRL